MKYAIIFLAMFLVGCNSGVKTEQETPKSLCNNYEDCISRGDYYMVRGHQDWRSTASISYSLLGIGCYQKAELFKESQR